MYTLYCGPGTRATAAHLVLAEAQLPHQLRIIDITANEHRSPEFLKINPRGTIPALAEDGKVVSCETVAIMLYLCDKHELEDLSPGPADPQRAPMLDWLLYHATEVQQPIKRSYYAHRFALRPEDVEPIRNHACDQFTRYWEEVEAHLSRSGPFHLGERISLPDLYLLVTGTYSHHLATGEFPVIDECMRRTAERPRIAPIQAEHLAVWQQIKSNKLPK